MNRPAIMTGQKQVETINGETPKQWAQAMPTQTLLSTYHSLSGKGFYGPCKVAARDELLRRGVRP